MAKYRTKTVVDAVQLRWDTWNEVTELIGEFAKGMHGVYIDAFDEVYEKHPGGNPRIGLRYFDAAGYEAVAFEDDWIVKGVGGRIFHWPNATFAQTYEPIVGPYYAMGEGANGRSLHSSHIHMNYNDHEPLE